MKKILLGTSAIVALGAMSTEAFAADKIALKLGGFHRQYIGYGSPDDSNASLQLGQRQNNEIYVNGSTTLDNGIDVGVRTEMEANGENTGNSTDRVYITVGSDAMGTLRLGSAAHMIDDYAVRAPMVGPMDWGDTGEWLTFNGTAASDAQDLTDFGDNTIKIGYHTPTFSGITAFASYSVNEGAANTNAGTGVPRNASNDSGSFGVAFEQDMGGAAVSADVSYFFHNGTRQTTRAGVNVGMSGFTVGGSYSSTNGDVVSSATGSSLDGDAWELGVSYETGPYSVAAAYMNSDAKGTTTAGKDETTDWQVGAGYDLGAGVGLVAQYMRSKVDGEGAAATTSSTASAVVAGIEIGF